MLFDCVYRFNEPPGYKGKRCRIISRAPRHRYPSGYVVLQAGDNLVTVEFESGEHITAVRAAVVLATSRPGQLAVWAASGRSRPGHRNR